MSTARVIAAWMLRVVCYGTLGLLGASLLVCGERGTSEGMREAAESVLGATRSDADIAALWFVGVFGTIGLAMLPRDVKRLFWWNERREGRGW